MKTETPMMKQYKQIKEQNKDSILLFRLGDFYEMFGEDAQTASGELDLVLTTRDRNTAEGEAKTPMCGVPYHSSEAYIARLVARGYKVAICEQVEDPASAKGIVDRAVTRVITPGTVIDTAMLDEGRSNYICSIYIDEGTSVCFADMSTGEISVTEISTSDIGKLENEISAYSPTEAMLSDGAARDKRLVSFLQKRINCMAHNDTDLFVYDQAEKSVIEHFPAEEIVGISRAETCAVGALISYLKETQKTDISHIKNLRRNLGGTVMELDMNTMRNLELAASMRTGEKKGSLLWVLDKTRTPMGRRRIRSWVLRPRVNVSEIKRRQNIVRDLYTDNVIRGEIMRELRGVGDLERLIGKIVYGNSNCRDLYSLSRSIGVLPSIAEKLRVMNSESLREYTEMDILTDIGQMIERTVREDAPNSMREGGMVKDGADDGVDHLRNLLKNSTEALLDVEAKEKARTGKKLKVGYNRVFGYYIEIPRSASNDVPGDYMRKQTLANCERFITQELKDLETELLTAKEDLTQLEYKIIMELSERVGKEVGRIQETSGKIGELDVYCSLAETAVRNNYTKPEIEESGILEIKDGRHPVVESAQTDILFVPNDTELRIEGTRAAIITGPNMAGKSTYMRQTALIVLMAQMGSYVPARSARIGLVDRVFTRIGASDDLSSGKSTFMVEMSEVSDILRNATERSLLILDEIGRGTSTYDGMSVARAVLEFCADKNKLGARTLFATHYHELSLLEDEIEGVINLNISAKKRGDEIIFLRKIVRGCADDSYGIEVANLAGVPEPVIKRAKEILESLESGMLQQLPPIIRKSHEPVNEECFLKIKAVLDKTAIDTISPLEALNLLFKLKNLTELRSE